jgi:hypothetical protein
MFGVLHSALDRFRGGGDAAVTIPSLDGAFRPNQRIETAAVAFSIDAPDNLIAYGNRLVFSSGSEVLELVKVGGEHKAEKVFSCESAVASLAAHPTGGVAIGLASGGVVINGGIHNGSKLKSVGAQDVLCPTALSYLDENKLLLGLGSQVNPPTNWKRDLLQRGATGSVWIVDLRSGEATCLAQRLGWPNGIVVRDPDWIVIAESWKHQLIAVGGAQLKPVLSDLPGYPARLARASDSGYWLAIFAPRSQLIEFVLREHRYRNQMMLDIDPEFWVAPSLHHATDYREPLQSGAIKQLGVSKAWAPSRSYGLIAKLDRDFNPAESFHSRANGKRHGITSCIDWNGHLLATSKGGNVIVDIGLAPAEELRA